MEWLVRGSEGDGQLCLSALPPVIAKNMVELRAADQKSREMLLQVQDNITFSYFESIAADFIIDIKR